MAEITFSQLIQHACGIDIYLKVVVAIVALINFSINMSCKPMWDA